VLLALPLAACGAPAPELPDGSWLAGEAAPFSALLEQLETLEGTPLAELAATARPRLEGCRRFVAHTPELGLRELAASIRCTDDGADAAVPPPLEALRGDRDFALAVPVAEGLRLTGGGRWTDGSLRLELALPADAADGDSPAALLLPRAEPVGAAVLSPADTLLRGRFGADGGLDLASLVPAGGAGDRLFRLKSQLFSSVVLTGVWELALYAPAAGETIPPAAVAAEVSDRRTASAAMESFLGEVRRVWRLPPPSRFSVARADADPAAGACLPDMRFLPGLEPCYVVTDAALVIGWNAATVERAVAGSAPGGGGPDAGASRLEVSLDRFPAAEEVLTEALRGASPEAPAVYPWRRLTVTGRRADGAYRFTAELEGR
jgi:hypothetical protein